MAKTQLIKNLVLFHTYRPPSVDSCTTTALVHLRTDLADKMSSFLPTCELNPAVYSIPCSDLWLDGILSC